jgi:hypothetical protein
MTSLDRARRFISQKTRVIAIGIVPLAGLVVNQTPAQAAVPTFNTGSCSWFTTGLANSGGGLCSSEQESAIDPTSGILGVKLVATGDLEPFSSAFGQGSGGTYGITVSGSGRQTGVSPFTGTIPVLWDFTATSSDGGSMAYTLTYTLTNPPSQQPVEGNIIGPPTLTETGTALSGVAVTGADAFTSLSGQNIFGYSISLSISKFTQGGQQSISLNIPEGSLDLAATAVSGTPEPGTIALMGGGLIGLGFLRRRKKNR